MTLSKSGRHNSHSVHRLWFKDRFCIPSPNMADTTATASIDLGMNIIFETWSRWWNCHIEQHHLTLSLSESFNVCDTLKSGRHNTHSIHRLWFNDKFLHNVSKCGRHDSHSIHRLRNGPYFKNMEPLVQLPQLTH